MRKTALLVLMLILSFSLHAEVYKTTEEITAYKNSNSSCSSSQDVENVTLTLLTPTQVSFDDGTDIPIPESYRNNAYTSFYWSLTGNLYNAINLTFKFSPMYSGSISIYNTDITISDQTTVIPYSVVLTHSSSTVTDGSTTTTLGTSAINYSTADRGSAYATGVYTTSYGYSFEYSINYADSVTITNPSTISTTSTTGKVSYNMSTNSYSWIYDPYYERDYTSTTCNTWTRTGYAVVTLKINNDGSWVDDTDVVVDAGDFKAYVTVTVSTE